LTVTIVPEAAAIPESSPVDRWARGAVLGACRRIGEGRLTVREGDRVKVYGSECDLPGLEATVTVHHPRAYRAAAAGSVGLARGYVEGWWDADDLVALLRIAARRLPLGGNRVAWGRLGLALPGRAPNGTPGRVRRGGSRRGQRPDPGMGGWERDRENIRAHYDLGDDFFALFLDPTLTYSCGIFESAESSLEQASRAKLDRICSKLGLGPGDRVLEIGTGWGSFALHAASTYGCHVTTTTISDRQFAHARRIVARSGLEDLVTVRNDDYRALRGTWDKIVSIEMIEAIGWRSYDRFFSTCANLLRPDGLMALQAIVIDDRVYPRAKRSEDFIKAMVFPGSCIPSIEAIVRSTSRASDLRTVGLEDIGAHYAETLARWRSRFHQNRAEIAALGFDEPFLRLWDLYLAYCQAGFEERRISDVQMMLAKPGWRPRSPRRDHDRDGAL
jgi:cyclopropane-fatty-acyl-phospholipid synthase